MTSIRSIATPVEAADSIAHRRMRSQAAGGPRPEPFVSMWPEHARRAQQQLAILVIGAGGGLEIVAVEPERYDAKGAVVPGTSSAEQLTARAKRLYKGQRAQLISFNVVLEA